MTKSTHCEHVVFIVPIDVGDEIEELALVLPGAVGVVGLGVPDVGDTIFTTRHQILTIR